MASILIVDSHEATRDLYQRELHRSFSVIAVADAEAALQVLQTTDLVAVIVEPAGLDDSGWNLISTIYNLQSHPPIRVILCSALDERRRGLALGAAAYLVKPVLPATLLETVHRVLQG
mgnify:CR=1 FL=1|jgi:DNA-binding response OmpR family regulator